MVMGEVMLLDHMQENMMVVMGEEIVEVTVK